MANPFNFGTPVPHHKFVGRWHQIEAIVEDLANSEGHSHAIIGGRRFGKSSFLEALQHVLIEKLDQTKSGDWYIFPLLINLKRIENKSAEGVFGFIANTLSHYFTSRRIRQELGLTFELDFAPTKLGAFVHASGNACSLQEFEEILDEFLDVFTDAYSFIRLVLLMDEAEAVVNHDWTEALFDKLRSLIYEGMLRKYVRLVIAGSSEITEVRQAGSPLFNMLKLTYLEAFSKEEILKIIGWAGDVPQDIADAVLQQCGGHPFIVQYLMHYVWEAGISSVTEDVVISLSNKFKHERHADLYRWQREIGTAGQLAYRCLEEQEDWFTEEQIRQSVHDPEAKIDLAVVALCHHGVAIHDGKWRRYRYSGELFKRWFTDNVLPSLIAKASRSGTSSETEIKKREESTTTENPEIFISYSWEVQGIHVTEALDAFFQGRGITIVRDIRDIGYKGLLSDYIERLGSGKYVVVVLNDGYLKSKRCMSELMALAAQKDFYDRIFPVLVEGTCIDDAQDLIQYANFWDEEIVALQTKIREMKNLANLEGIQDDLNLYVEIRHNISALLNFLRNVNTRPLHGNNFEPLYQAIQLKIAEESHQPSQQRDKSHQHLQPDTSSLQPIKAPELTIDVKDQVFPTAYCYSLTANEYPLVTCTIDNTDAACIDCRVSVEVEIQGFSDPCTDTAEIASGQTKIIRLLPTITHEARLTLTEIRRTECRVIVRKHEKTGSGVLRDKTYPLRLHAADTALLAIEKLDGTIEDLTDYLSVFVTPHDETVGEVLTLTRKKADMVGYQGDPIHARQITQSQAKAYFETLQEKYDIQYSSASLNFGKVPGQFTQRIRLPKDTLNEKSANCIDGTVLFASLLQLVGFEPFLVIVPGHAFVGWRIWRGSNDYDFLETTMIGSSTFEEALNEGNVQYQHAMNNGYDQGTFFVDVQFIKLVDVADCRDKGIDPLM